MKKNNTEQQIWLAKKAELEKEIHDYAREISSIPDGRKQVIEANEARERLESFEHLHGKNQTEDKKRRHDALKQDFEQKKKNAKEVVERHQKAQKKMDQMKQELESMQFPVSYKDFQSQGVEALLKKSVGPWISTIKELRAKISRLETKRKELHAELERIDTISEQLDEDDLLNADIEKQHVLKKRQKESSEKAQAVHDLIQQTDQAINDKENQLNKAMSDFCAALREAVDQYTGLAAKKIKDQFEQILETETFYSETFERVCNELIQLSGANPNDVFGGTSYNIIGLNLSPLYGNFNLKDRIKEFMQSVA